MLSKCLNQNCSETFQYLGQGRLYRIDFTEAGRKRAQAGKQSPSSNLSKSDRMEHFWLCENCAATMTIELSEDGAVRLVPLAIPGKPVEVPARRRHKQVANAS